MKETALTRNNTGRPKLSKGLVKSDLRKKEDLTGKYGVTLKLGYVGRSGLRGYAYLKHLYRL